MFAVMVAALTNSLSKDSSAFVLFAQRSPLTLFFLMAYAWAWTVWFLVPRIVRQHGLGWKFDTFEITLIIVGAFGPTVAASITRWLAFRDLRICPVWTGSSNIALGIIFGAAGLFVATVALPAIAIAKAPLYALHWSTLLHWSTYNINYSNFLGGPLNEEPGWRGFALPRLQARFGPFFASMILAPLWAAWHLPMFLIPGWNTASLWEYILILLGVSVVMTGAASLARFSVLVAILLHAFFNLSAGVLNALIGKLPSRSHDTLVYAFAVCGAGIIIGWAGFRKVPAPSKLRLSSADNV